MALLLGEGMEGRVNGGAVSRSLNVVYIEGLKEGRGVLIESEIVKAGKRLDEFAVLFSDSFIGGWMWCVLGFYV